MLFVKVGSLGCGFLAKNPIICADPVTAIENKKSMSLKFTSPIILNLPTFHLLLGKNRVL